MLTDVLAPASAPTSGVDKFLSSTLAGITPKETTSTASADKPNAAVSTPPAAGSPDSATPAPVAPSGDAKPADAAAKPVDLNEVMRQLNDQTKANKKLGRNNVDLLQQVKSLKTEIQEMRAKYDGTYTPPAGPTPEQERAMIEYQAREAASRKVADEKYGAEQVTAKIFAEDSPYRQLISEHPWVHARVMGSDTPILEAFSAMDEYDVLTKFGTTPDSVLQNVEKAVKDKLWKEWTEQMAKGAQEQPGRPVATLGDARGESSRQTDGKPNSVFDPRSFNRHIA